MKLWKFALESLTFTSLSSTFSPAATNDGKQPLDNSLQFSVTGDTIVSPLVLFEGMMLFTHSWSDSRYVSYSWTRLLQNYMEKGLLWQKLSGKLCITHDFAAARKTGFQMSA